MKNKYNRTEDAEIRRQRRLLAEWLHEWQLELALRAVDSAQPPALLSSRPEHKQTDSAVSGKPEAGQVRLLLPDTECTSVRPLYVLLLAEAGKGRWLAAPFGRFAVPAIPGEWRTGLRAMHLRVLCLWNTRYLEASRLRNAWKVRTINPDRLATACGLLQKCFDLPDYAALQNDAASSALRETGPPLLHPADPRHQYLTEETDQLDSIGPRPDGIKTEFAFSGRTAGILIYPEQQSCELLRAAERKGKPYGEGFRS